MITHVYTTSGGRRLPTKNSVSTRIAVCACLASFALLGSCTSLDASSDELSDGSSDAPFDAIEDVDTQGEELNGCDDNVADASSEGCDEFVTCEILRCDLDHRTCEASDGVTDARCGACLDGAMEETGVCVSLFPVPTGVTASQGASAMYVRVTWDAVTDATGYHVYRDGTRITTTPVSESTYNDVGAPAGGVPDAVWGVSASRNGTDDVQVTWHEAVVSVGPAASYQIRAVAEDQQSLLSSEVPGFRGAFAVTSYEVQVGNGSWESVGSGTNWTDVNAPAGTLAVDAPRASTALTDRVDLSVAVARTSAGASRSYRVRAVNAAGTGTRSYQADGHRSVRAPSYVWAWAGSMDGSYTTMSEATWLTWSDTEIASGETRWYRVEVHAAGATSVTSRAVEGRRPLRCVDLEPTCTSVDRTCAEGVGSVDAVCTQCLQGLEESGGACVPPIAVPEAVSATQGLHAAHVLVTWGPVAGATGYHVYRDGARITETPVIETTYNDPGAPEGGMPDEVSGLAATTDRFDSVIVSWSAGASPAGERATYAVRAVSGDRQGVLSSDTSGFRGAHAITGYEVQVGSGSWETIWSAGEGSDTEWTDVDAPAGVLAESAPFASTIHADRVDLSMEEARVTEGASRSYRVRAVNAAGVGAPSGQVDGNRSVGPPAYQWEWSSEIDGSYTSLSGATSLAFSDAEIALDETRWYRAIVYADGADPVMSSPVAGRRIAPPTLGARCTSDGECGVGAWCPTNTNERRCSPLPTQNAVTLPLQWVPRGEFMMGSPVGEVGRIDGNEAQVSVTLTRDYFVMRTPVTQGQWAAVVSAWNALPEPQRIMSGWPDATPVFGTTPSCFRSPSDTHCANEGINLAHPVERVSWWDAVVFANALSILEGLDPCYALTGCGTDPNLGVMGSGCLTGTGSCTSSFLNDNFSCSDVSFVGTSCTGYRLPTEAEWERAARGGTTTATYGGDLNEISACATLTGTENIPAGTALDELAWYACNSGQRTQMVAHKMPNAWGLYDMLGGVWEWTGTWYATAHSGGTDPLGPSIGPGRVIRGGSWNDLATRARAASRTFGDTATRYDIVGAVRLVRTSEL